MLASASSRVRCHLLHRVCRQSLRSLSSSGDVPAAEYDVVVVGGGVPGATFAAALGSSPLCEHLKVAVVDPRPAPKVEEELHPLPDPRIYSINPASIRIFEALGVWDKVVERRASPYTKMQVWDAESPGFIRFKSGSERGQSYMGYMVENAVLEAALWERTGEMGNVEWIRGAKVEDLAYINATGERHPLNDQDQAKQSSRIVMKAGDQEISARLVVGADGATSKVRDRAGLASVGMDYNQHAIIATMRMSHGSDTAWQRFLPTGPLAILPVHGDLCSIVWSTTPAHAKRLLALEDDHFAHEVQKAMSLAPTKRLPGPLETVKSFMEMVQEPMQSPPEILSVESRRFSFPLGARHTTKYYAPRVVLVGDSAHSIHPLAGQGLNLGIADAASAAYSVVTAVETGQDIGSMVMLKQYEDRQLKYNVLVMSVMTAFKVLFGTNASPVAQLRGFGMSVVNSLDFVKEPILKSMGEVNVNLNAFRE